MYCKYCGAEIPDGTRFCPYCGHDQQGGQSTSKKRGDKVKKPRKKRSKGKIIFAAIMILLVVIVIGGAVGVFTSPVYKLYRSLEKEDYASASEIYKESVQDNFLWEWITGKVLSNAVVNEVESYGTNEIGYEEALAYLEAVSQMSALSVADEAAAEVENLQELYASKQAYELAESYYEAGDYEAALSAYQEVDETDTENYADAQSKIASATDNYRAQIIESIGSPSTIVEYETAISMLNSALVVLPEDEELLSMMETYSSELIEMVKASALTDATSAISTGNYSEAFEVLETALKYTPDDSDLLNLLSSVQSQYEAYIMSEAEAYMADYDYDSAIELLEQALSIFPDSESLQALQVTIEEQQPVKLTELFISDSYRYEQIDSLVVSTDVIGNVYNPGNLFQLSDVYSSAGFVDYYLNGAYTKLTGTIALSNDSDSGETTFTIYGDGDTILYTTALTRTTPPLTIDVDLTGVTWIEIQLSGSGYWDDMYAFLSDFVLYKN